MQARVVFSNVREGKREETIGLFSDVVAPAAQKQKGFSSGLLRTDPGTGKGVSIGLWATENDMIATENSSFYRESVSKFEEIVVSPAVMEHSEVSNKNISSFFTSGGKTFTA